MHITFDNSRRLGRNVYYFEYNGVRFKLIQNHPRKWSDVLLTIVDSRDSLAEQRVYAAAGEFLSALSWTNSARVALQHSGGVGIPAGFRLRQAKCRIFTFPEIPYGGQSIGYGISPIPVIDTNEQRLAMALLREALSSNKSFLSFLFYWQVMEIGNNDPVGWINKMYYRRPAGIHLLNQDVSALPLGGRRLGEYLQDDCRHAIAHIRRRPGRRPLMFDVGAEDKRIVVSTRVVEEFARHYIKKVLGLGGMMYLVRMRGRGFPVFVDEAHLHGHHCVAAYHT